MSATLLSLNANVNSLVGHASSTARTRSTRSTALNGLDNRLIPCSITPRDAIRESGYPDMLEHADLRTRVGHPRSNFASGHAGHYDIGQQQIDQRPHERQ